VEIGGSKVDPLTIDAVLTFSMQVMAAEPTSTDRTFGLWQDDKLVTFAKAYSGLTDAEMKEVDANCEEHRVERLVRCDRWNPIGLRDGSKASAQQPT
jgi:ATP-dependent DNA ligase